MQKKVIQISNEMQTKKESKTRIVPGSLDKKAVEDSI
jgi:hypothetical protein